ncbi:MAG: hypothetical protein M1814_005053 [Vezdaea aestivalis]|nr:MAG: hypothetical protein M1814_005053 [Vezdaea aestivalis]
MTPHPYFTDQSAALAEEFVGKAWKQVWLMGADTLIRLFAPRYYPGWDPPLQALRAFMGRAKIRVESRAGVPDGGVEKLEAWRERLGRGQMDTEGGDREWVKRIDIVGKKMESGRGVSSSAVREMVREGLWDKAEAMMPLEVGKWVKDEGFYRS